MLSLTLPVSLLSFQPVNACSQFVELKHQYFNFQLDCQIIECNPCLEKFLSEAPALHETYCNSLCLADPFRQMGHDGRPWSPRSRATPQGLDQSTLRDREGPKSERCKESVSGQCRMRSEVSWADVRKRCIKDSRFCEFL